jgi:Protein of unknown function (DUF4231)
MTKHRLNTREAAEALGISVDAVRMRARRGSLASERENGKLYVWVDDDQTHTKHNLTHDADIVQNSPAWNRLNDQLQWYDMKSAANQKSYKRARMVEIVLAAFIPVLALTGASWSSLGAAFLGAIISIMAAYRALSQSDTLWLQYRNTAEQLKREKYLFLANAGPYSDFETPNEALRFLAERVETILFESTSQSGGRQDPQGPPQVITVPRSS